MQLPSELRQGIERRVDQVGFREAARSAAAMSARYREGNGTGLRTDADRAAYIATRMPATYAAICAVLEQLPPELQSGSLLDLGAGPGTSLWAADAFEAVTLMEQDHGLIGEGRALAARSAAWIQADLRKAAPYAPHDVVLMSYSYGEIEDKAVLRAAWEAAGKALIIIEPGTVAGFACVRKVRDQLLALGAHIAAPCPHANPCPMTAQDWCHFAARVERSSMHRRLKGGDLGHEDEKYSYLIATRSESGACQARILRHPKRNPGFVTLTLCGADGLRSEVVSRKSKEAFRAVKHADWGSRWEAHS